MTRQPLFVTPRSLPAQRLANWLALLATLGGLVLSVGLAVASDGFYHDDDITHYLFARDAWSNPQSLWHWWGRPGYNLPTMLVAHFFGVLGCRVFSGLQTAAVAYLAYLIARRLARSVDLPDHVAAIAPALVWLQPVAMTLSYTTLTETPAALYLTAGVFLYLRGNRIWGCAVLSPMFITRYETMALAPVVAAAVIFDALRARRYRLGRALLTPWAWACIPALLWAPGMDVAASALAQLPPEDSILYVFARGYSGEYGHGAWNHFLIRWLLAAGAGTLALAAAGALRLGRRGLLVTAMAGGLVVVHTAVYLYGSFGSGGYERFLVPVCGMVAALAAVGLGAAWHQPWRRSAEAALIVLGAAVFALPQYVAYVTQSAPWLQAWLTMQRVIPVAALLVSGGCLMLARPEARRAALAWPAAGLALALLTLQAAVMIRPLTYASSPLSMAVRRCVNEVRYLPYGANAGLTTHVLVRLLRDDVELVDDIPDAQRQWRRAHPGTLFYWDSKYGGDPVRQDQKSPLYWELSRRGRLLAEHWVESRGAAVFLRLVDPPPTSAASSGIAADPPQR